MSQSAAVITGVAPDDHATSVAVLTAENERLRSLLTRAMKCIRHSNPCQNGMARPWYLACECGTDKLMEAIKKAKAGAGKEQG